jgi:hypothetical protein
MGKSGNKIAHYFTTLSVALVFATQLSAQSSVQPLLSDTLVNSRYPLYPLLKILSVSYDQAFQSDYHIKYKGAPDESGQFSRGRSQAYLWVPFVQKKYFTLSFATTFTRDDVQIENVKNPSGVYLDGNTILDDYNTSVNVNYRTKLFSRQLVINGSLFAGTSPAFKFRKWSGQVFALLIIKDMPNTIWSVGLVGTIDPSAATPVLPLTTFWHRFDDPDWELDVVFPQSVKIRRSHTLGGWISAGADLASPSFFIRNIPGQSQTYESAFTEITPNLSYDAYLFKNILLTVQGGYRIDTGGRLLKVNDPAKDKIATVDFSAGPYARAGISFVIPNWKIRQTLDNARK